MSIRALSPVALMGQPLLAEIFEFPATADTYWTLANGSDEIREVRFVVAHPKAM